MAYPTLHNCHYTLNISVNGYGYGIFKFVPPDSQFGETFWGHAGGVVGYMTYFIYIPKHNFIITAAFDEDSGEQYNNIFLGLLPKIYHYFY